MDVGKEKESSWAALGAGLHIMFADGCCIPGFFDRIRIPGRKKGFVMLIFTCVWRVFFCLHRGCNGRREIQ